MFHASKKDYSTKIIPCFHRNLNDVSLMVKTFINPDI